MNQRTIQIISVLLAIGVIVGIPTAVFGTKTVDPGEKGVYIRNGEVKGTVGNGVQMMIPGIDRIRVFNMRTTKFTTTASALTNDNINVKVSVAVRWDIREGELMYVYKNIAVSQKQLVNNAVKDAVISGIKTSRRFNSANLSTRAYRKAVKDRIQELFKKRGLKVTSITIKDIEYPPSVEQKFQKQKETQAQKEIAQNKLEIARKRKQKKLVQARAKREAIKIKREALTSQYINFIRARNIDKTDTVYVIPRSTNTTVTNEVSPSATNSTTG